MSKLDTGLSAVRTVLTLRLAPVLLVVFAVVWPLAGFPWWPLVFVLALGVVLRVLGFGYLIAGTSPTCWLLIFIDVAAVEIYRSCAFRLRDRDGGLLYPPLSPGRPAGQPVRPALRGGASRATAQVD